MDQLVGGTGSILLFIHLLGGASWLGASVLANVAVVPYIGGRPAAERRELAQRLILAPERLLIGSALLAVEHRRGAGCLERPDRRFRRPGLFVRDPLGSRRS